MIAAIVLAVVVSAVLLWGAARLGDRPEDVEDAKTIAFFTELHHEEFMSAPPKTPAAAVEHRPPQATLPPPPVTRVPLPPVTGAAVAVLAPLILHLRRHAEAERAAWQAEVLSVFPPERKWAGDDTLTNMRAITAEVA